MSDGLPKPEVITAIKINEFTLYAYAYRTLTKREAILAKDLWLKNSKLKTFPKTGSAKIITTFGYNLE